MSINKMTVVSSRLQILLEMQTVSLTASLVSDILVLSSHNSDAAYHYKVFLALKLAFVVFFFKSVYATA